MAEASTARAGASDGGAYTIDEVAVVGRAGASATSAAAQGGVDGGMPARLRRLIVAMDDGEPGTQRQRLADEWPKSIGGDRLDPHR